MSTTGVGVGIIRIEPYHRVIADETYIGGKPRKENKKSDNDDKPNNKRGRGTKKMPVLGAAERDDNIVSKAQDDLSGEGILNFIMNTVKPDNSTLITDEYRSYNTTDRYIRRRVIKHNEQYVDGDIHITLSKAFGDFSNERGTGNTTITENNICRYMSPKPVTNTIIGKPKMFLMSSLLIVLLKLYQTQRQSLTCLSKDLQAVASLIPSATACYVDSILRWKDIVTGRMLFSPS